ncbi:acyl-CoA dehydrogenase, partial [Bacillus stratosphericus]
MSRETLLKNIAELVQTDLVPLVEEIDRKGLYPEDFLRKAGAAGGFACVGSGAEGGSGLGLG